MICENMPFSHYRQAAGINASSIKAGRTSMLHMHTAMTRPSSTSPAMKKGTIGHLRILEPDLYYRLTVIWDGTKKGEEWDEFKSEYDMHYAVTTAEDDEFNFMADRFEQHPEAMEILAGSRKEVAAFWESPEIYGVGKARFDMLALNDYWADYKTTSKIHPRQFQRQAYDMGYHNQAGWAKEGLNRLGENPDIAYYLIAQESKKPWDVVVYQMSEDMVEHGRREGRELAMRYRACEREGVFGGCADDQIHTLNLPDWVEVDASTGVATKGMKL